MIIFLGGLWGLGCCGFIWLIVTAIRDSIRYRLQGIRSYREHTTQGAAGGRRLLLVWRDLNRKEAMK